MDTKENGMKILICLHVVKKGHRIQQRTQHFKFGEEFIVLKNLMKSKKNSIESKINSLFMRTNIDKK